MSLKALMLFSTARRSTSSGFVLPSPSMLKTARSTLRTSRSYAERAVVSALLYGKKEVTLDLAHVVSTAEAQKEVKALFKEYALNSIGDLAIEAIDKDIYPDVKN